MKTKGLITLGGAMTILAIGLNTMTGTLAGSAALLVAASALLVLTPVLAILGAMSWSSIVKGLVTLAGAFAAYYNSVSGVDVAKLSGVIVEFRNLVDLANGIKSVDTSGMSTFAQNLTNLGNAGIDGFINAFTNANSRVSTAANTMVTTFINAAKAQQGNLTSTFTTMINGIHQSAYG